jgi:hypothetical protein
MPRNSPFLSAIGLSDAEAENVLDYVEQTWKETKTLHQFLDEVALKRRVWKGSEAYFAGIITGCMLQCELCDRENTVSVELLRREIGNGVYGIIVTRPKDGRIVDDEKPKKYIPDCFGNWDTCNDVKSVCPVAESCRTLTESTAMSVSNKDKTDVEDAALQESFSAHERR